MSESTLVCIHWTANYLINGGACDLYGMIARKKCEGCQENSAKGVWPLPVARPIHDPAVVRNIEMQQRNCRGCGE